MIKVNPQAAPQTLKKIKGLRVTRLLKRFIRKHRLLILIILFGIFLRWINLFESTSFFYDQARDTLMAREILSGDLKFIGPPTDAAGLFMGPLWYYLLAVLYFFTGGDPVNVVKLISTLDILTIVLFYLVGSKIFSEKIGMVAAGLWSISAHPVAYSRTLASPSTSVFWTLLIAYLLLIPLNNRRYPIILAAASFAVLLQFNPATAVVLTPAILGWFWIKLRKKISLKLQISSILVVVASLIPQILFELKHSFISFRNLPGVIIPQSSSILPVWISHAQILVQAIDDHLFIGHSSLTKLLLIASLLVLSQSKNIKEKLFFYSWLILPLIYFLFLYPRGESHPHYLLSWIPVVIFITAGLFVYLAQRSLAILLIIVVVLAYFQTIGLHREIILKDHIAQPGDPNLIGFGDLQRTIDLIYKDAEGQPFGYYAYNVIPYWADENWQYMFSWYGLKKYGYLPSRHSGVLVYVIYEPEPFLGEDFQKEWLEGFDLHYKEIGKFQHGALKIKKMILEN
jgi:4-amino-4-deoxy-L-arabinose transferase-like glycosyltransferase